MGQTMSLTYSTYDQGKELFYQCQAERGIALPGLHADSMAKLRVEINRQDHESCGITRSNPQHACLSYLALLLMGPKS